MNRGWSINVWRIGLSEHTKEEDEYSIILSITKIQNFHQLFKIISMTKTL